MPEDIHGILLLDKPLGVSSAGAVARVKRLFNARKAGHTGSLDPLASGMLPICFGEATKFGAQLLDADKSYRVTVRLGERTASADQESAVIERRGLPDFSVQRMLRALEEFPRDYAQVPPMHSAIKQDGKPLYEYARAGQWRERQPRAVVIREMRLIEWRSPDLSFDVRCTKGAYIRVLGGGSGGAPGDHRPCRRSAPLGRGTVRQRAAMDFRDPAIDAARAAFGGFAAGRCGFDRVAAIGFAGGRRQCVPAGADGVAAGSAARR